MPPTSNKDNGSNDPAQSLPLKDLPSKFHPRPCSESERQHIDTIKSTLNFYVLCIDGKQYADLSHVFAQDAITDYGPHMGKARGIDAITDSIKMTLGNLPTQHALSSISVRVAESGDAAFSVAYMRAMHFGEARSAMEGECAVGYVQYQDHWIRSGDLWKIKQRNVVPMGPMVGNLKIFKHLTAKASI